MIKRVVTIIVLLHVLTVIQSCCTEEYQYKWRDFNIDLLDNSGTVPVVSETNVIDRKAFGMRVTLDDTIMYAANPFAGGNICYATSCDEKLIKLHDVTSVQIKTLHAYSSSYPPGADITSLFRARPADNTRGDYISISAVMDQINAMPPDGYPLRKFDLYLLDTTATPGEHQFEVIFNLTDGSMLKKRTETFVLN